MGDNRSEHGARGTLVIELPPAPRDRETTLVLELEPRPARETTMVLELPHDAAAHGAAEAHGGDWPVRETTMVLELPMSEETSPATLDVASALAASAPPFPIPPPRPSDPGQDPTIPPWAELTPDVVPASRVHGRTLVVELEVDEPTTDLVHDTFTGGDEPPSQPQAVAAATAMTAEPDDTATDDDLLPPSDPWGLRLNQLAPEPSAVAAPRPAPQHKPASQKPAARRGTVKDLYSKFGPTKR